MVITLNKGGTVPDIIDLCSSWREDSMQENSRRWKSLSNGPQVGKKKTGVFNEPNDQ